MASTDLNDTYGAMLIGVFFAIFFQGMLSVQAYIYYESFPGDLKLFKALVAIVWTMDLAHLVLVCQSAYHYLVANFGNFDALSLSTKPFDTHLVFVGSAALLCQTFFIHRVYTFSKSRILTGLLLLASATDFALGLSMTVQFTRNDNVASFNIVTDTVGVAMFALGAAIDLTIAALLVYYLSQGRTSFEKTDFVLSKIIQYTVATGLVTSLLAVACIIAYFIKPASFIFIAMHFSLGRMYTNALLATLNSRRNLRVALGSTTGPVNTAGNGQVNYSMSSPAFAAARTQTATTTANSYPLSDLTAKSFEQEEVEKASLA